MVTISNYGYEIKDMMKIVPHTVIDALHYIFADYLDRVKKTEPSIRNLKSVISNSYFIIVPTGDREISCDTEINSQTVSFIAFDFECGRTAFKSIPRCLETAIKFNDGSSVYFRTKIPESCSSDGELDLFLSRVILFFSSTGCKLVHSFSVSGFEVKTPFGEFITAKELVSKWIIRSLQRDLDFGLFHSVFKHWLSEVGVCDAIDACQKFGYMELLMVIIRYTKDSAKEDTSFRL